MDVSKNLWGPALWRFLQITAAVQTDRESFTDLIYNMCRVLPCPECRLHLKEYVRDNPPEEIIIDTEDASSYIFALHNSVNERIQKPVFSSRIYETLYGPINQRIVPPRFCESESLAIVPVRASGSADTRALLMGAIGRMRSSPARMSQLLSGKNTNALGKTNRAGYSNVSHDLPQHNADVQRLNQMSTPKAGQLRSGNSTYSRAVGDREQPGGTGLVSEQYTAPSRSSSALESKQQFMYANDTPAYNMRQALKHSQSGRPARAGGTFATRPPNRTEILPAEEVEHGGWQGPPEYRRGDNNVHRPPSNTTVPFQGWSGLRRRGRRGW